MSAYRLLHRDKNWRRIREDALETAGYKCEICGGIKELSRGITLICHELWDYNDKKRTATVAGFEIHCFLCDLATHIGRAMKTGGSEKAIRQLRKVNGISREAVLELYDKAMEVWEKRSKKKWKVKVSQALLKRYPALALMNNYRKKDDYEPESLKSGYPALPAMRIVKRNGKFILKRN